MDEQALNELLECSVCLDQLDHTSKVLPCQHTFCKRCLLEIVSTKQELRCPECRSLVEASVDELPTNILLVRLLEGLKTQTRVAVPGGKQGSPKRLKKESSPQASATTALARQQQLSPTSGSSRPCARALFNYEGKDPSDLSFKKGDIVNLRRQIDENWFDGELNGHHGFFPVNYVHVITSLPQTIPQCKALYDFEIEDDKEDDCLTFKKEEVLTILKQVDDNWLEGKKGDKIGIFPISFVEVNEPGQILLRLTNSHSDKVGNKEPPKTPAHPKSLKRTVTNPSMTTSASDGHTILAADKPQPKRHSLPSVHQPVNNISRQSPEIPSATKDESVKPEVASTSTSVTAVKPDPQRNSPPLYMAMYNYKPQRPDEIELRKGDYYCVIEKCQDGWYKGHSMKEGVNGVFPGNYVQSIKTHPSVNKSTDVTKGPSAKPKAPPPQPGPQEPPPNRPPSNATHKPKSSPSRGASTDMLSKTSLTNVELGKGGDRGDMGPALPRSSKEASPAPSVQGTSTGAKSSSAITNASLSKASSPILATSKSTRYIRASKSLSPNTAAAGGSTESCSNSTSNSLGGESPIWKHSLSATGQITPPNVALGAKGKTDSGHTAPVPSTSLPMQLISVEKDKKEKKEKEKLGLMKRLTSAGKSKKSKTSDIDVSSLSDSSVVHTRSASYSNEVQQSSSRGSHHHKKSGSFDSTVQQSKPSRPKPLIREKCRCIESYPSQGELELDLKIGDIIYVHKKREDGWFKGTLKRSGKMGLFPGSFVEPCEQSK